VDCPLLSIEGGRASRPSGRSKDLYRQVEAEVLGYSPPDFSNVEGSQMQSLTTNLMNLLVVSLLSLGQVAAFVPMSRAQTEEHQRNCAELSPPGKYPDYGRIPDYSVERRAYTTAQPRSLNLQISVSPEAWGESSMVCLACKLATDFPTESAVDALIFDDKKAARNLALVFTDQTHYGLYLWHLRAHYTLDRKKKLHVIEYVVPIVEDNLLGLKRTRVLLSAGD
jgi:hypothetical protein